MVADGSSSQDSDVIGQTEESSAEQSQIQEEDEDFVDLPGSEALDAKEAGEITRAALTTFVVLCGPVESGKTTLLTSIYEKFNEGQFATYLFAGSRTLMGFESRCFLHRTASYSEEARTERTLRENVRHYLHLRVKAADSFESKDVIFPDVTGELYQEAESSTENCKRLTVLKRADRVVVLIDGAKIAKPGERHVACAATDSFIRRCIESGMVDTGVAVDLVLTKWDLVAESESSAEAAALIDETVEGLQENYADRLASLEFWRVAARPGRPNVAGLSFAYGVEKRFKNWPETRRRTRLIDWRESAEPSDRGREFDLVAGRIG